MTVMRRTVAGLTGAAVIVVVASTAPAPAAGAPVGPRADVTTELVNRNTAGEQASGGASGRPSVSSTALIVAFDSRATNLVAGDTNDSQDVFVRYRAVPLTVRASVSSSGVPGNSDSDVPSMDSSAQNVVFRSFATNLVPGDTNGVADIFARHQPAASNATTSRISVSSSGAQANASSGEVVIARGDRFVAFTSKASNLVPGDTNGVTDIFVHDLETHATSRVSVRSNGVQANARSLDPAISGNGRFVAFSSDASNLVPGDSNGKTDVFVHDRQTGTTARMSVSSSGAQADASSNNPSVEAQGDIFFVAFTSAASNLVPGDTNSASDVFLADSRDRTTKRISVSSSGGQANSASSQPVISAVHTGYIAFTSQASNLVPGDTNLRSDIFRHHLGTAQTERRSLATGGGQATGGPNGNSQPAITTFGKVAYVSDATNLAPGDTNPFTIDIFLTEDACC